jgi:hypothetical protein
MPSLSLSPPAPRTESAAPPRAGPRWPDSGRRRTVLVVAPLAVLGLLLAPLFRDDIGLDGLAYVSIARQFADGELAAAVNGYWGPLWSWLLVPLLLLGVEPLLAASFLQVGSAVLALVALRRLADLAGMTPGVRDGMALAVSPFLLAVAHYGIFVDVLLAAFLLLWCSEVLRSDFADPAVAARAGLWGGLAVLTKVYALPFVVVHLAVVAVLSVLRARSTPGGAGRQARRVLASAALALLVVGVLFAPWVAALSASYDRFTVTKSARYNVTIAGPGSQGNPIRYAGLLAPPNPSAVSAWEDPSTMPVDALGWSGGGDSTDRLLDNVSSNLATFADLMNDDLLVVTALGLAGTALVLLPLPGGRQAVPGSRFVVAGLGAAAGVYSSGYLLLFMERRYTWFALLLAAVPAGLLLQRGLATVPTARRRAALVVAAALLAVTAGVQALPRMAAQVDEGARAQEVATALREAGGLPGPVASNGFWERTAVICFELECQYYGQPREFELTGDLPGLLERRGVRSFVAWGDPLESPPGPETTPPGLDNVHVYEVAPPGGGS